MLSLLCVVLSAHSQVLNRQSYVTYGETYLGNPWKALSMTSFARYQEDGNRVEYESQVFGRRRQLAALVMAEVVEQKGRFMADIITGLDSMLAEPWCPPRSRGESES